MNAHLPQSLTTSQEIWELARPSRQIVTPQTNSPIVGIVQDSLLASYIMTRYSTLIPKHHMLNILALNDDFDGKLPKANKIINKEEYYSGGQVLTTILPSINLQKFSNTFSESYNKNDHTDEQNKEFEHNSIIMIKNGKVLSGSIDKSVLGAKKEGSIPHIIYNDFGSEATEKFLSMIQKYTNQYILYRGFSTSIGDMLISNNIQKNVDNTIVKGLTEISDIMEKIDKGLYIPPVDMTISEYLELEATDKLNNIRVAVAEEIMKDLNPEWNGLMAMIKSGSKGDVLNIGQIIGTVGQQTVDRSRILPKYGYNRTLPCFRKYDNSPMARGFVQHSFLEGLSPEEYFFHAMAGREGIIDTAIRTRDSGYISRKLMKAMEDLMVSYKMTVNNANGHIVQFLYGDDGIDPVKIEKQRFGTIMLSNSEMKKEFLISDSELKKVTLKEIYKTLNTNASRGILENEFNQLIEDRDYLRNVVFKNREISDKLYCPVNIRRLIVNAINRFAITSKVKSDLNPLEIISDTKKLIEKLPRMFKNVHNEDLIIPENCYNATRLLSILIREHLSVKNMMIKNKFNKSAFNYLLNEIELKFLESIVNPGEMVGAVASQSLGEPSTQLTLNTFHSAGIQAKSNVTAGVPRLQELINVLKNPKNPFIYLYLHDKFNKEKAEEIRNQIQNTKLEDFVEETKIYFDPSVKKPIMDSEIVKDFFKYSPKDIDIPDNLSNMVIRMKLNRNKMIYNQMTMNIIRGTLNMHQDYFVISSDDNSQELILRIYLNLDTLSKMGNEAPSKDPNNITQVIKHKDRLLSGIVIRGIEDITKVQIRENKNYQEIDEQTGEIITKTEYYLDADGMNIEEALKFDHIDTERSISTDPVEILKVFGIEAARQVLLNEITEVLTFNGIYVNYHNVALLVDIMTRHGELTAVSRHGFNKLDRSPISKISFEEQTEKIKDASLYAEFDNMRSVSARVMFAHTIQGGTGLPEVMIDESMYGITNEDIDNLMELN